MSTEINPFRAAKAHLWDGNGDFPLIVHHTSQFICMALGRACDAGQVPSRSFDKAETMISNRLTMNWLPQPKRAGTVGSWLFLNGFITEQACNHPTQEQTRRLQEYRHRWLDQLAIEWDQGVRS